MKTKIILGLLLVISISVIAQVPDTLWTRTYGGIGWQEGRRIRETSDNCYLIAGRTDFNVNATGVEEVVSNPDIFTFSFNSPAKSEIIFRFSIPEISNISLKVYDLSGRIIDEPISGEFSPATYEIPYKPAMNGIYFYRLEFSYHNETGKFMVF